MIAFISLFPGANACAIESWTMLAFGMPSGWEWIVLLVIGLLIFGRRLPEVGRSLGRGIVEFKKGIKGIEDEIDEASNGGSSAGGGESPKNRLSDDRTENPFSAGSAESSAAARESGK